MRYVRAMTLRSVNYIDFYSISFAADKKVNTTQGNHKIDSLLSPFLLPKALQFVYPLL